MLEFYLAYADYGDLMELTEALFVGLVSDLFGASRSTYQGTMIDFTPPWPRLRFFDGITAGLGLPAAARNDPRALIEAASARGIAVNPEATLVALWKDLFETLVEPTLIRPTFVVDFPIELCPLAKRRRDDPTLAERFELFVAGKEMANGYSELNDPLEQKERFLAQLRERARGDEEAHRMDEDYLRALEYGMPPTAGEGIGVDRLIMLFADQPSIREVIFFPQLRPEGGS
jgi:lysyl-tRNA synthetase class 2